MTPAHLAIASVQPHSQSISSSKQLVRVQTASGGVARHGAPPQQPLQHHGQRATPSISRRNQCLLNDTQISTLLSTKRNSVPTCSPAQPVHVTLLSLHQLPQDLVNKAESAAELSTPTFLCALMQRQLAVRTRDGTAAAAASRAAAEMWRGTITSTNRQQPQTKPTFRWKQIRSRLVGVGPGLMKDRKGVKEASREEHCCGWEMPQKHPG